MKKGDRVLEVVGLGRIGGIELKGDTMVSAGVLRRCKEKGIGLYIRLKGGYGVSILDEMEVDGSE